MKRVRDDDDGEDTTSESKRVKRELTCPICLDELVDEDRLRTPCGHYFHPTCLNIWKEEKQGHRCPVCRLSISDGEPVGLRQDTDWFNEIIASEDFSHAMRRIIQASESMHDDHSGLELTELITREMIELFGERLPGISIIVRPVTREVLVDYFPHEED